MRVTTVASVACARISCARSSLRFSCADLPMTTPHTNISRAACESRDSRLSGAHTHDGLTTTVRRTHLARHINSRLRLLGTADHTCPTSLTFPNFHGQKQARSHFFGFPELGLNLSHFSQFRPKFVITS